MSYQRKTRVYKLEDEGDVDAPLSVVRVQVRRHSVVFIGMAIILAVALTGLWLPRSTSVVTTAAVDMEELATRFAHAFTRRDVDGMQALFSDNGTVALHALFVELDAGNVTVHSDTFVTTMAVLFGAYSSSFMTLSNVNVTGTGTATAIGYVQRALDNTPPEGVDHPAYTYSFSMDLEADAGLLTHVRALRNATKVELDQGAMRLGAPDGPAPADSRKRAHAGRDSATQWATLQSHINNLVSGNQGANARALCNTTFYTDLKAIHDPDGTDGALYCNTYTAPPQIVLTEAQVCVGNGRIDASCFTTATNDTSCVTTSACLAETDLSTRIKTINTIPGTTSTHDFTITGGAGITVAGGTHGITISTTAMTYPVEFYLDDTMLLKSNQSANTVWAGPASGVAASPAFRLLVAADVPPIALATGTTGTLTISRGGTGLTSLVGSRVLFSTAAGALIEGTIVAGNHATVTRVNDTAIQVDVDDAALVVSVGLSAPSDLFDVTSAPITHTGTLTFVVRNQTGNRVWASPADGSTDAPGFRALVAADLPTVSIASGTTGTLPVSRGGTNNAGPLAGSTLIMSDVAGTSLVEASVTSGDGIAVTQGPGAALRVELSSSSTCANATLSGSCIDISNAQCTTPPQQSCVHPDPVLASLSVSGATTLGTSTACTAPLSSSCISISNQACPAGALSPNCIPSTGIVLDTLTVTTLTVLNTTTMLDVSTFNGTVVTIDDLYLHTMHCLEATTIPQSCYDLSGASCPLGALQESCVPNNLTLSDASVTGTLTVNDVVCTGQPLPGSCIPARVATVNGIAPDSGTLDFTIASSGAGLSVTPGTNGITLANTGVTSVAATVPGALLTISGSPVTTTGTLALSLATQTGNTVFASPADGSSGTPTFRALVTADLPAQNITLPADVFDTSGLSATFDTQAAHTFFAGPSVAGPAATPSFRTMGVPDLPALGSGNVYMGNGTAVVETALSYALSLASVPELSVSGSPLTGAGGTFVVSKATQAANTFWAGSPVGAASQPVFRTLVVNDLGPLNMTNGQLVIGNSATGIPSITTLTAGSNVVITHGDGTITISASTNDSFIGTVTSVALALPASVFDVTGSPVTAAGTLAATLIDQPANTVFVAPNGTSGTPTFRVLLFEDLPALAGNQVWLGSGATTLVAGDGVSITYGTSDVTFSVTVVMPASVFSVSSGTTVSLVTQTANKVWAGPVSGGAATPTFRSLVLADMPGPLNDGQLYIGSTSGGGVPVVSTLSAGTLITITPGSGTLTVSTTAEINTASNVNAGGVGVYKQKTSSNLEFRGINAAASGMISVALDAGNNEIDIDAVPGSIDHDALLGFVTNEHVDHSAVSIVAGTALTGGGDLTASRTLSLTDTTVTPGTYGSSTLIPVLTVDQQGRLTNVTEVLMVDLTGESNTGSNVNTGAGGVGVFKQKAGTNLEFRGINVGSSMMTVTLDAPNNDIVLDVVPSAIDHNALLNYAANRHVDHSAVSIIAGTGLTGGGDLTASRTLTLTSTPSFTSISTGSTTSCMAVGAASPDTTNPIVITRRSTATWTLNYETGAVVSLGTDTGATQVYRLAFSPNGTLYGMGCALADTFCDDVTLLRIDSSTGVTQASVCTVTSYFGLTPGPGFAFVNDTHMYIIQSTGTNSLYVLDIGTCSGTLIYSNIYVGSGSSPTALLNVYRSLLYIEYFPASSSELPPSSIVIYDPVANATLATLISTGVNTAGTVAGGLYTYCAPSGPTLMGSVYWAQTNALTLDALCHIDTRTGAPYRCRNMADTSLVATTSYCPTPAAQVSKATCFGGDIDMSAQYSILNGRAMRAMVMEAETVVANIISGNATGSAIWMRTNRLILTTSDTSTGYLQLGADVNLFSAAIGILQTNATTRAYYAISAGVAAAVALEGQPQLSTVSGGTTVGVRGSNIITAVVGGTYSTSIGVVGQAITVSAAATSTITLAAAFQVLASNRGAGPLTIVTLIGMDIPTTSVVATNAYGIRLAAPTGGTAINNALNFVAATTAAGGITFGADALPQANLYRSATQVLSTDATLASVYKISLDGAVTTVVASQSGVAFLGTVPSTAGLLTVSVNAGGTGYSVGNVLTVTGCSGTGGTVTVATVNTGVVLTVTITTPGKNYVVASGCATTGGAGSGATINTLTVGSTTITNAVAKQVKPIDATGLSVTPTVTTATGVQVVDSVLGSGAVIVGTHIGIDVQALAATATNAYGLRLAAPTGGSSINQALNFVAGTTAAAGITFGADASPSTNLYRSAAATLECDATLSSVYKMSANGAVTNAIGSKAGSLVTNNAVGSSAITNAIGYQATAFSASGMTATPTVTTATAFQVANNILGTGPAVITTQIGLDVPALSAGSTNAYGVRLEAPTGGSSINNALNFVADTTAAGGITFGADAAPSVNLYRSAANVLKTDADITVRHVLGSSGSAPTAAIGSALGSTGSRTATVTTASTDCKMQVTAHSGGGTMATNAVIITVTYGGAFSGTVNKGVVFSPANQAAAALTGATAVYIGTETTTTFTLNSGNTGLSTNTDYIWNFGVCT